MSSEDTMSSNDPMSSEVLKSFNNMLWKDEKEKEKELKWFLDTSCTEYANILIMWFQ